MSNQFMTSMRRTGRVKPVLKDWISVAIPWAVKKEAICTCGHYESRHNGLCLAKRGETGNNCLCRNFSKKGE